MDYRPQDKGKCLTCGLLGKRVSEKNNVAIAPAYYETDHDDRKTGGEWPVKVTQARGPVDAEFFCFVAAAQIMPEIRSRIEAAGERERGACIFIFEKERKCSAWYPYSPGLGPKDHYDKMNMERLEESRREWEMRLEIERKDFDQKLEADRKKFDLELFNISQQVQADSRAVAEKSDRFNRQMTWFFIALAVLEVFATGLSLAFPNGLPWLANLFSK